MKLIKRICSCLLFAFLFNSLPTNGFLNSLMNRVQKKWMMSWQQMRDQQIRPRKIAEMRLNEKPKLVQTVESKQGKLDIAVSCLNISTEEIILRRIENVSDWMENRTDFSVKTVGANLGEPNGIGKVDDDMIVDGVRSYWWVASNFYTPQNVDGKISFISVDTGNRSIPAITITSDEGKSEWFYSTIEWVDMNQDGWLDIVTSRSRGQPESIQHSELVWFENPGYSFLVWRRRQNWRRHSITYGPDFAIKVLRIPLASGESRLVIIGAGFWDNKLYAVWTEDSEEDWTNLDAIKERVIDNHGWFYKIEIADVNADGRDDIIASTWSFEIKQGSVFVYEIPCNFIHGKWNRHQLLDGTMDLPLPGAGSGGWISVFHPSVRYSLVTRKRKPFILVSGDDEGRVYVLIPNSRKTNNWEYTSHTVYQTRGPVGGVAVDDLNFDGFMEIVIPAMDQQKLVFFTYKPGPIGPEYFLDQTYHS